MLFYFILIITILNEEWVLFAKWPIRALKISVLIIQSQGLFTVAYKTSTCENKLLFVNNMLLINF